MKDQQELETLKNTKILFVDPEIGTRHLIVNLINKHYCEERFAALAVGSAQEALKLLWEQRDIQIVFTELQLPKISGLEFIEIVRQIGLDTHLFVVTTYGERDSLDEAMFQGVRGFFDKAHLDLINLMQFLKRYRQEVLEFTPNSFEEPERVIKKADGKEYGSYHYIRWRTPNGKLRGISLGRNEDEEEQVSEQPQHRAKKAQKISKQESQAIAD